MAENKTCVFDVFIKDDRVDIVKHYIEHIRKLFGVELRFTSHNGKQYMPIAGHWLDIEGHRERVIKAREYVKCLSNPEEVIRLRFPPPVYDLIYGKEGEKYTDLEKDTAANITFYSLEEVEISGSISSVTKASIVIEEIITRFIQEHSTPSVEYDDISGEYTPSVDEDSGIYSIKCDSNSECRSSIFANRSSVLTIDEELDLDLQEQEEEEGKDLKCDTCTQRNSQEILDSALMEYAKKLGYSEVQVKSAMKKLGPDTVDQNELLHELIKASNSLRDGNLNEDSKTVISNFYESVSNQTNSDTSFLRHVVVDGSNVAMSHGKNQIFSCRGIAIVVHWFQKRGHGVTVFVPNWRKESPKPETPISNQEILTQLSDDGVISFTPSRRVDGKLIQCYDDRYIVRLAVDTDGIVVSNDHFRDLQRDSPEWKDFINTRLLMYTFAGDIFMPPDDPLGRHGPTLNEFLRKNVERRGTQHCPYGRKCTFGPKCKFYHPERRHSGSFVKKPLPPLPHQQPQSGKRPRSDPTGQNVNQTNDSKQRPISLPNLEQLYISPPTSLHRYIYFQNPPPPPSSCFQRPVSGPPFQENNAPYPVYTENNLAHSSIDLMQKQHQSIMRNRKFNSDYTPQYNHTAPPPPANMLLMPQQRRPQSGEYINHAVHFDNHGRPLSSDFSSRPSSGEYSYSSGSRPASGDFGNNNSRPSSGDFGGLQQWTVGSYQRQIAYNSHGNFYPMKSYKTRGTPLPETKEEPRQTQGSLKIELVEKLREKFPDQYDKILWVLRTYPHIRSIEDAIPIMAENIKA